ncbi:signal peptidase II [Mycoplasma sp. P36-A1]|uniref:signal peptidase II n=1 Tax=Mycoplasma sp. P36-A1 TaxID=3252900 RepID=UPI003C30BB9E
MKKSKIIIIAIILLFIDQISKYLVASNMNLYQNITIIPNFFSLFYIRNSGAAFSILEGHTEFFYLITVVALVVVYFFYKEAKTKLAYIATTLLLVGTLGNFIDRLLFKEVIDFFSFSFKNYNFAIFNVADIYVVLAVALLILDSFRKKDVNEENNNWWIIWFR